GPPGACPDAAWSSTWRDVIRSKSAGMGMAAEGEALIAGIEEQMAATVADFPQLQGRQVMFVTHLETTDLSVVRFYTANDTRVKFFEDLGLVMPQSVLDATESGAFSGEISAEQIDAFDDVELIVTYGGQELIDALNADPLTSKMPAVASGAIVTLANDPLGTAANPTPLS